ncbi:MAG: hypothetical protein CME66_05590 [Halobacteriovoraceae bacterium]|nr:hypothetical protein [Halobacteriovoraceae bacterium]MAX66389.1 hypothetical protein [Halobacteriovoraceae bacterium]
MDLKIFEIIDEQNIVCFTGRLNLLKPQTNEHVGSIIFIDGQIVNALWKGCAPFKALMNLFIKFYEQDLKVVVEPELIDEKYIKLSYPLEKFKRLAIESIENYLKTKGERPSDHLKLYIKPEFIKTGNDVVQEEFNLLCTLGEYNKVSDVYEKCEMLDHEITYALINLRKKNAIKVVDVK